MSIMEQIKALAYMYNELGVSEFDWKIPKIAELAANANSNNENVPAPVALMNVEVENADVVAAQSDAELFDLSGSTMTLGNTLQINFAIDTANLEGADNYAVIAKEYADERGTVTKTVPQSEWKALGGTKYYVSYAVSAKEMNDTLTTVVYNAAGEAVSNAYTDSVAGYCVRMLNKEAEKAEPSAEKMSLFVDMVNYGAAAQTEWGYNVENLANAGLTEEQKALATEAGELKNILEKGTGYAGTTLSLKENILLNVVYENETIDQAAYAVVSFTDHYGDHPRIRIRCPG